MAEKVVIIGGGASGIISAISIKKYNPQVEVLILERFDRIGKKILATGNGKCNIGNTNLSGKHYNHFEFMSKIIDRVDLNSYVEFLTSLGLLLKVDSYGRLYPYSESANTVMDVLLRQIEELKIKVRYGFEVVDVEYKNKKFYVYDRDRNCEIGDKVVFSCGSSAGTKPVTAINILKKFNHNIVKMRPGLVGLKVKEKVNDLKGIRQKVQATLLIDGKNVHTESGEVIFKEDGISGIVIMNISRFIQWDKQNIISLNLIDNISLEAFKDYLRLNNNLSSLQLLQGMLPKMLAIKLAKSNGDLYSKLTDFRLTVTGDYGYNNSQLTLGGVSITDINDCFESIHQPGLYIVGELLDIDGECGGYNLYNAISNGILLGKNLFTKVSN